MAQSRDYIPKTDADLAVFAKNLYNYALEKCGGWGVLSPKEMLEVPIAAFEAALAAFNNPNHGKIDTANKNSSKDALNRALRTYVQGFIARNPGVTDEDKEKMSLPLRDSTPTAHPVPSEKPEITAVPAGKGMHTVTVIHPRTQNKDKPEFVTGAAFARRIRNTEEPVSRADDMPSEFQAGTVKSFQYTEDAYGKVVDYAAAYENSSGKRGPWSNVVSLLISG